MQRSELPRFCTLVSVATAVVTIDTRVHARAINCLQRNLRERQSFLNPIQVEYVLEDWSPKPPPLVEQ